jgi:hypothetical protein
VVALGRVIIGDIAATLVDLSSRQLLRVDEAGGDWQLTSLLRSAPQQGDPVLKYEQILLDGLDGTASLPTLAKEFPAVLDQARAAVVHDAVHHGWLRHIHHDERTAAGQELAGRIRAFQRSLGHLHTEGRDDVLTGALLPYALHFGMVRDEALPLVRFAHAWVAAFGELPTWSHPKPPPKPDFEARDRAPADPLDAVLNTGGAASFWLANW